MATDVAPDTAAPDTLTPSSAEDVPSTAPPATPTASTRPLDSADHAVARSTRARSVSGSSRRTAGAGGMSAARSVTGGGVGNRASWGRYSANG